MTVTGTTPTHGRDRLMRMRSELHAVRAEASTQWGSKFIDLSRSEPLIARPPEPPAAEAWWDLTRRYQRVGGTIAARSEIAELYGAKLGGSLDASNVAILPGALAALTTAFVALVEPGDEVVVPVPYFPHHLTQAELAGGAVRLVDTEPFGWRLTPELLRKCIGRKVRALVLSNPANPTGVAYSRSELVHLGAELPDEVAIVADEVYAEFAFRRDVASTVEIDFPAARRWISVRSASKTLGRPGLRAAVVLGPAKVIADVEAAAAAVVGAASAPAEMTLLAGLRAAVGADHVRPYRKRRDRVIQILNAAGLEVLAPEGTYYTWIGTGRGRDTSHPLKLGTMAGVARLATCYGVFAMPGEYFGGPATHARISLSLPQGTLATGIDRIVAAVRGAAI